MLEYFADLMRRASPGLLAHAKATERLVRAVTPYLPRVYAPRAVLFMGAFLHDVGKVMWPKELFAKRVLTPADWALIKTHPVVGANLVKESWPDVPEGVIRIILEHHERPGGEGYPRGIEPSYPALVVSACDVFDAMTHDRNYREAIPVKVALAEIREWALGEIVNAVERATRFTLQVKKGGENS
ncbi:MAG: HD domain-containing phosphohydrolase [Bacillota bacterium]